MSGCREKFPRGTHPGTRLLHPPYLITFIRKYVFQNNSGAFKDYGNVRLNVWIQLSKIKEKTIFSASEGGK